MRLSQAPLALEDDLEFSSLVGALEANVLQLRRLGAGPAVMDFGPRRVDRELYTRALEFLLFKLKQDPSGESFRQALREHFEPYEVYGQEDWGQVFITSYFEPVIEGALKKSARFTQPLYGVPKDLVVIDLNTFAVIPAGIEKGSRDSVLRGRLVQPQGKEDLPRIVAFPERARLQDEPPQAPVLAWVDPVDAFFLEIQGSGVVRLKDGRELRVGYAAQNGHPYVPIGKHLVGVIPKEKITLHSIESHLRAVPPEDSRKIMNLNPSFVFFRPLQSAGVTYFGTEVVEGRTIATDQTYFPKGSLAYLQFESPHFDGTGATEPSGWQSRSRFVLDQDVGGAIRGPHRVDLFWGRGPAAKQAAGVMKGKGRLLYLVPGLELLNRLSATASKDNLPAPENR